MKTLKTIVDNQFNDLNFFQDQRALSFPAHCTDSLLCQCSPDLELEPGEWGKRACFERLRETLQWKL